MAWEWRVLFALLVIAGLACVAVGLLVVFVNRFAVDKAGQTGSRGKIRVGDRFDLETDSAAIMLITIGALMWGAAALLVLVAGGNEDHVGSTTPERTPTSFPRIVAATTNPTTTVMQVSSTTTPTSSEESASTTLAAASTTSLSAPTAASVDLESRFPSAIVEACDGRWAVSLGSTMGEVTHPDDFRDAFRAQYGDDSLLLLQADSCASLAPGAWYVIGGIHPTSDDAAAECRARGLLTIDDCFAFPLTADPDDRQRRVAP